MSRQTFSKLAHILGIFSCIFAGAMIFPCLVDYSLGLPHASAFLLSMVIVGIVGGILLMANKPSQVLQLKIQEAFLTTTMIWVTLIVVSALPIYFGHATTTFIDALFEATSGLTTTGATVIAELKKVSPGLLLWRAMLQWFGGIGIIVMALTVLPMMRIGGMQLYRNESSDKSEKILPRLSQITGNLLAVYGGLTVFCIVSFWIAGMPLFESICHSFTTISTGGLSVHDSSFAFYKNPIIEIVAIFFMVIGGSTLILYVKALRGQFSAFTTDRQLHAYLKVIVFATLFVTLSRLDAETRSLGEVLRTSCFQVVSIMTTTGFTTDDYNYWAPLAQFGIFVLMFIGGCTGSTSGSIKIFRFQVIGTFVMHHMKQFVFPRGVFTPKYNDQILDSSILMSVFVFLAIFILTLLVSTAVACASGLDLLTGFSGALASISNVGPGFGAEIGPSGTYAKLPDLAKLIYSFDMLLGRLEFLTVIILLLPSYWKETKG